MAWDKADLTQNITSQVHAIAGPQSNKLRVTEDDVKTSRIARPSANTLELSTEDLKAAKMDVQPRTSASQALKQNQSDDIKNRAVAPAQEDYVEISTHTNAGAQAAVSHQSDSPQWGKLSHKSTEATTETATKKDSQNPLDSPGAVIEPPSETGEKMQSILSGPTPASVSKDQYSSEGFGHGGPAGPSGVTENPLEINQNHPNNPVGPKTQTASLLENDNGNNERPQAHPAAVESEMGQVIDKMV